MGLIDIYDINEGGSYPLLIKDSWQVSQLNYCDDFHLDNLVSLKIHRQTDRAFALLSGVSFLIAMDCSNSKALTLEVKPMKIGTSYNVSRNTAYALVMESGSKVFTAEKSNTHTEDLEQYPLSEQQLATLKQNLMEGVEYER